MTIKQIILNQKKSIIDLILPRPNNSKRQNNITMIIENKEMNNRLIAQTEILVTLKNNVND